jgi:Flp pilus assembly protein TadG
MGWTTVASESVGRLRGSRWWRDPAGNTLVLFPAAVLIVFGLGAVALDTATVFLGQRRLVDVASAVANDAIAAVDVDAFFAQDDPVAAVPLDRARAEARRDQIVARQSLDRSLSQVMCTIEVLATGPPARAEVTCTATVAPILAPLWPGAPRERSIRAREVALGEQLSG